MSIHPQVGLGKELIKFDSKHPVMGTAASSMVVEYIPISNLLVEELDVCYPAGITIPKRPLSELLADPSLGDQLEDLLQPFDPEDPNSAMIRSFKLSKILRTSGLSEKLIGELSAHYPAVAGEQEQYDLVVRTRDVSPLDSPARLHGMEALLTSIQRLYAEYFANLLIDTKPGEKDMKTAPRIVIQRALITESTGVAMSFEPKSQAANFASVYSTWGLAEDILRRTVARDEYLFHKRSDEQLHLVYSRAGEKEFELQWDHGLKRLQHRPLNRVKERGFSLSPERAQYLGTLAVRLEKELGGPVDFSWVCDGEKVYLIEVNLRPPLSPTTMKFYHRTESTEPLLSGQAQGHSVGSGRVRIIRERSDLEDFQAGEVMVAVKTEPDWEPAFRKASAIITEKDRRVSHSSILAREMGIPAIIGCPEPTLALCNGQTVTVSCCQGQVGHVLPGRIEHTLDEFSLEKMPDVGVQLMVNLSMPERALATAQLPWAGAGLVRSEFMIGGWVKIHPLALLQPQKLNSDTRNALDRLCSGFESFPEYFLTRMTQGIALFASAFWPRPVNIRLSDFKSNEYARLLGGDAFEPKEREPMLGWRGASRFLHPDFRPAVELELEAIRRVRDQLGLTNVRVTIPFCRLPEEGEELLQLLASCGLKQGENALEIWVMAELPSNVVMASDFAALFDGMSIGSSDLTSLTLGVARNSETIMDYFDELHPVMMKSYETIIEAGKAHRTTVSFCGQIASQDPESAALLAEMGVDILSLAPDALHPTLERLRL